MSSANEVGDKNKGGRPRKPVDTSAPEFKEAVAAAVKEAIPDLAAMLVKASEQPAATPGAAPDDATQLMQQLAMAIAQLTDQNQGGQQRRVAPEVLAKWVAARERMFVLLDEARKAFEASGLSPQAAREKGLIPEYRVVNKTYLNERIVEPWRSNPSTKALEPVEIFWTGAPNDCLRPANDVAKGIFQAYVDSVGGLTALTKNADRRGMWVTAGGLVVKGDSRAPRTVAGLGDSNAPFADDLGVKGAPANDPTAEFVHVLGTVAAPARQNYTGGAG